MVSKLRLTIQIFKKVLENRCCANVAQLDDSLRIQMIAIVTEMEKESREGERQTENEISIIRKDASNGTKRRFEREEKHRI